MTENILTLDPSNKNVVAVVADGKKGRIVYKRYVAEFKVTTKDDVSAHVAALSALSGLEDKKDLKYFANKVRNGLNYWIETPDKDDAEDQIVNLLTVKGTVTLAEMTDAEIVAAVRAEADRRNS